MEINIGSCTKDPETCPVVQYVIDVDAFESAIESMDPDSPARRKILGDFATSCAKRTCPGQDPELTRDLLRRKRESEW